MLMQIPAVEAENTPRVAPHNIEAEQALLGAILVHNEAFERASEIVEAKHFYDPVHQTIFETIAKLITAGRHASPVTVRDYFETAEPITDDLTVPDYLNLLANNAPTIAGARDYAQTIRDLAMRRQIIVIGEDAAAAAYEAHIDVKPDDLIEDVEQQLYNLAENGASSGSAVSFADSIDVAITHINEAHMRGDGLHGLPTGLADLDKMLGGLSPGGVIILAGRPSMGKTALATNIAWNIARKETPDEHGELKPNAVDFYSLEMKHPELSMRILSAECGISSAALRRGTVSDADVGSLMKARSRLRETPLWIDDRGGITLAQLAARARRRKRKHDTKAIFVDYLQLIRGSGKENRTQDLTQITVGLKALAKELDVPIIALSQLSRQVENRSDKRPQLSDLRESGSIEQDADVVMFVYREEYYVERSKPSDSDLEAMMQWEDKLKACAGKGEIILAKQRHGQTGTVSVAFNGELTLFSNLARERQDR